jgi:ubiquinone/menaquinone biosynthesis C-methylase UbiE
MTISSANGFEDVDRAADPRRSVSYLDAVTALAATRSYKFQTFDLMGIKPGDTIVDVGCGTGEDLRQLATIVGPSGRVVGVGWWTRPTSP